GNPRGSPQARVGGRESGRPVCPGAADWGARDSGRRRDAKGAGEVQDLWATERRGFSWSELTPGGFGPPRRTADLRSRGTEGAERTPGALPPGPPMLSWRRVWEGCGSAGQVVGWSPVTPGGFGLRAEQRNLRYRGTATVRAEPPAASTAQLPTSSATRR